MSQENREVVRSVYASLTSGDWDEAFSRVAPDFDATFERGMYAGTHRGRDSIQALLIDQLAAFETWVIEPEELLDRGDQVVALIKARFRPKGTHAEVITRWGHVWTVRDGTALSMRTYPNPDDALEAVGLGK
jgi:ketosteroid isomerase-like protein